jgi:hypothetical protein
MKQLRFGDLVRASGRPHPLTLWTPPKKNRELQAAIRDHRVLTVQHPNVGQRRDVGIIGFHPGQEASYLVFPRRLAGQMNEPVVGINYELLEQE